ncbi:MAG TPA: histidine triad nucleotide-binding protein [Armatimonadota bacterium]|nr:histidine triad nucleotide-binding protein [Armatimonadota bacterium]HOQ30598.1 histidine triad nucleotide-binding protein [Armatimonadota bacterium]HPT98915.1 histidine triad nucleotide-binding protein [Armatimonadota bacterium]
MSECIFCRIAAGSLPARVVYQDEQVVAFEDVNPQAPVHLLVIPRKHIPNLLGVGEEDEALGGHLMRVACQVAREKGVAESGFRVVANINRDAGQSVDHLHLHVLGGRGLGWPPG